MSLPVKMIFSAVQEVLKSGTPNRALFEGLTRYDFKIGEPRQNLMQISFSALAGWPLFFVLGLIWLDPTRSLWSFHGVMAQLFGEDSSFRFFLLSGQISDMATVLAIFFFLEWVLRLEYFLIAVVFYFLSQSQLHLHLALSAVIGVYLSKACYGWWLRLDLESRTRQIWTGVTTMQLLAVLGVSLGSLIVLDQYQQFQYFSGSQTENRYQFLFSVIFSFQFFSLLLMSIWGHFFFQKKVDPSYLPVYFSSSAWVARFGVSSRLNRELRLKTQESLKTHESSLVQLRELKDQSPAGAMKTLDEVLHKELGYLQTAASRLTID